MSWVPGTLAVSEAGSRPPRGLLSGGLGCADPGEGACEAPVGGRPCEHPAAQCRPLGTQTCLPPSLSTQSAENCCSEAGAGSRPGPRGCPVAPRVRRAPGSAPSWAPASAPQGEPAVHPVFGRGRREQREPRFQSISLLWRPAAGCSRGWWPSQVNRSSQAPGTSRVPGRTLQGDTPVPRQSLLSSGRQESRWPQGDRWLCQSCQATSPRQRTLQAQVPPGRDFRKPAVLGGRGPPLREAQVSQWSS